ncbi:MAG TPA: sulfatase-like hydrolase/transferase [Draconibacterium sp.]|nr:sulfatase-like hydrolase/transferase [Draconibacterium sp.]
MNCTNTQILRTIIFILAFSNLSCSQPPQETNQKPNIVFILADDMGYGDPQCYNPDSKIPTPNIDQLAAEGMMFRDAHSAGAWCVPSRYGLMTGQYPGRIELNWRDRSLLQPTQETLATLMKRNGYKTACVGKWHLGFDNINWEDAEKNDILTGGPVERGFDYFFGMHASLDIPPYFCIENDRLVEKATGFTDDNASEDATSEISGAFWRKGACSPNFKHKEVLDVFFKKAENFVASHVKNDAGKPFFLYFPFTAPHTPWLPKDEFVNKSGAGEYGDFTMQVDQLLGQIRAMLKEKGVADNTLIVFTTDNGPVWFEEDIEKFNHDSKGGLKGMKIDLWEGGSRIPFIVSWPGHIPEGTESNQLIGFTDMMATFASIVGDKSFNQSGFDSYDFTPVWFKEGYDIPIRNELVMQDKSYRKDNYKLILGSGLGGLSQRYDNKGTYLSEADNKGELYDLSTDPTESNNLYNQQPERVKQMKAEFDKIMAVKYATANDDVIPAEN